VKRHLILDKELNLDLVSFLEYGWEKEWQGMPEFIQNDLSPFRTISVYFKNEQDMKAFSKLIAQKVTKNTKSIWYPKVKNIALKELKYIEKKINPKYPVYIISKGRWESRLTVKALEKMDVSYHIVVEPQEYNQYAEVIDPANIYVLPFSNLGQGSIPARNWVWEHSISIGAKRHWILDDNIRVFFRSNQNLKVRVWSGTIFKAAEDFVDRYENVALAGFQYKFFFPRKYIRPPFYLNTRIYSMILIDNNLPYRWRGIYNEDTDLSLRVLKDGWCTILFNCFSGDKSPTMTVKGGNTEELYQDNGRLKMAESLVKQHHDVTKVSWKWGRFQHHVDYRKFRKNKLKRKEGVIIPKGINNYGMVLKIIEKES